MVFFCKTDLKIKLKCSANQISYSLISNNRLTVYVVLVKFDYMIIISKDMSEFFHTFTFYY